MSGRVITVLGAGNMRTGPAVVSTLSQWYPDFPVTVHLFDANPERLELIRLLAEQLMDAWNSEVPVFGFQDWDLACKGTTDLIVTLHEDCARRMRGGGRSVALEYFEKAEPMDFYLGGDRNKPTPVDQLSEQTKRLLIAPDSGEVSRVWILREVVSNVLRELDGVRVLNLMRGVELMAVEGVEWPDAVNEEALTVVPHQILRWVRGDEEMDELRRAGSDSPLLRWLVESERVG
ncbi:hypothetical protein CCB80_04580 [Armatimonadetes bacterium Uphvl-Ar1]|nr:hypothetical protein CCB80_04580 [Armatimonadetes bacterium Uphvl-Ar1]